MNGKHIFLAFLFYYFCRLFHKNHIINFKIDLKSQIKNKKIQKKLNEKFKQYIQIIESAKKSRLSSQLRLLTFLVDSAFAFAWAQIKKNKKRDYKNITSLFVQQKQWSK